MDHQEKAAQLLTGLYPASNQDVLLAGIGHAILGLCQKIEEISCVVAIPVEEDDEDDE